MIKLNVLNFKMFITSSAYKNIDVAHCYTVSSPTQLSVWILTLQFGLTNTLYFVAVTELHAGPLGLGEKLEKWGAGKRVDVI